MSFEWPGRSLIFSSVAPDGARHAALQLRRRTTPKPRKDQP